MRRLEGYFLVIIAGILYGTIPIFATLLSRYQVSSMEQIGVRLLLSVLFFFGYYFIGHGFSLRLAGSDYLKFSIFGLVGVALFFTLYVSAAILTSVAVAVLLLYTQPVFTLLLSRIFLGRKVETGGYAAIALALAGVGVIFQIWQMRWEGVGIGHLFALITGLLYAFYLIFMNMQTQKYQTVTVTCWSFLFGLIWLMPLWYIMNLVFGNPAITAIDLRLPGPAWLLLAGFTIVPTILGYLLFNHGMRTVEPHRAGVLVLSEPLGAIALSALILGQPIRSTDWIGGFLIILAFMLIRRRR